MFEIPADRLPPGFAERVEEPPSPPASPRPAATAVLLRDAPDGPEALLLRRHRQSGFVPGAWVFPGGRVDEADTDPWLMARAGLAAETDPPAPYWMAAVREVFEETGVLLARGPDGGWLPDAGSEPELERWREALMEGGAVLRDVLAAADASPDLAGLVPCAHWITPVAEPRRYDTRFFLAALPAGRTARPDPREMTDAAWLTPDEALARFRDGRLPMVFPTAWTLESLRGYTDVAQTLDAFRGRGIRPIQPRLVRSAAGVRIVLDPDDEAWLSGGRR